MGIDGAVDHVFEDWDSHTDGDTCSADEKGRYFAILVWARDEEHARKIANDKRAEYLASMDGLR